MVGPTGVFVLDAKNWRGVVQADGKGELLLNGKPTAKADIRRYVGRIMGVKEKVRSLPGGAEFYFQGVFVFTAARVEAAWGKTGNVHCLREDQLRDYIVEKEFGRRLKSEKVELVAQAFLGLAYMDRGFAEQHRHHNLKRHSKSAFAKRIGMNRRFDWPVCFQVFSNRPDKLPQYKPRRSRTHRSFSCSASLPVSERPFSALAFAHQCVSFRTFSRT